VAHSPTGCDIWDSLNFIIVIIIIIIIS